MSVYVDQLAKVPANSPAHKRMTYSCHMMADTEEELELFRRALRLRREWRHGDHYDLAPLKRSAAIVLGAIEVDTEDLAEIRRRRKTAASIGVQQGKSVSPVDWVDRWGKEGP